MSNFQDVREALANRVAYLQWATGSKPVWDGDVPPRHPPVAQLFDWLREVLAAHDTAIARAERAERKLAKLRAEITEAWPQDAEPADILAMMHALDAEQGGKG